MAGKSTGPFQTHEIEYTEKLWIRIIQKTTPSENQMNKIMDNDGILRINSRIHGIHQFYSQELEISRQG